MKKLLLLLLLTTTIRTASAQDYIFKNLTDHFSISKGDQGINIYGNDIKDNLGNYFLKSSSPFDASLKHYIDSLNAAIFSQNHTANGAWTFNNTTTFNNNVSFSLQAINHGGQPRNLAYDLILDSNGGAFASAPYRDWHSSVAVGNNVGDYKEIYQIADTYPYYSPASKLKIYLSVNDGSTDIYEVPAGVTLMAAGWYNLKPVIASTADLNRNLTIDVHVASSCCWSEIDKIRVRRLLTGGGGGSTYVEADFQKSLSNLTAAGNAAGAVPVLPYAQLTIYKNDILRADGTKALFTGSVPDSAAIANTNARIDSALFIPKNGYDIANKAAFRTNLNVYSKSESDANYIKNKATLQTGAVFNVETAIISGITPAPVSTIVGTSGTNPLQITWGAGGATTSANTSSTGGRGADVFFILGKGGDSPNGIGGKGATWETDAGDGGLGGWIGGAGGDWIGRGGNGGFGANNSGGSAQLKGGFAFPSGNGNGGNVFLSPGAGQGTGVSGTTFLGVTGSGTVRGNTVLGKTIDDYLHLLQVYGTSLFSGQVNLSGTSGYPKLIFDGGTNPSSTWSIGGTNGQGFHFERDGTAGNGWDVNFNNTTGNFSLVNNSLSVNSRLLDTRDLPSIASFVPYTGGTSDISLGNHSFKSTSGSSFLSDNGLTGASHQYTALGYNVGGNVPSLDIYSGINYASYRHDGIIYSNGTVGLSIVADPTLFSGTVINWPMNKSGTVALTSDLSSYPLDNNVLHLATAGSVNETVTHITTFNQGINATGNINATGLINTGGGFINGEFHLTGGGYLNFEPVDPTNGFSLGSGGDRGFVFHNSDGGGNDHNWNYLFNNTTGDWYTSNGFLGLNYRTLTTRDLISGAGAIASKDSTLQVNKNLYDIPNKATARTNLSVYSKSEIGAAYVPYTGATTNVDLGNHTLSATLLQSNQINFTNAGRITNGSNIMGYHATNGNHTFFNDSDNSSLLILGDGTHSNLSEALHLRVTNAPSNALDVVRLGDLSTYALDNSVVHLAGNETITGVKAFNNTIISNNATAMSGGSGYNSFSIQKNPIFGFIRLVSDGDGTGGTASSQIIFDNDLADAKGLVYNPTFYGDTRLHWGTDKLAYLSDIGGYALKTYVDSLNAAIYSQDHIINGAWGFNGSPTFNVTTNLNATLNVATTHEIVFKDASGDWHFRNVGGVFELLGGSGSFNFLNTNNGDISDNLGIKFLKASGTGAGMLADTGLNKNKNLYDLADKAVSRTNLSVYSKAESDAKYIPSGTAGFIQNNATLTPQSSSAFNIDGTGFIGKGLSVGGSTTLTNIGLRLAKNITGGTTSFGLRTDAVVQPDVTAAASYNYAAMGTAAGSYTTGSVTGYTAAFGALGAGSAVTALTGYLASSNLTAGTSNYGFRGQLPAAAGRWNLYMDGTAQNYINGNLGLGITTPTAALHIAGTRTIASWGSTSATDLLIGAGTATDNLTADGATVPNANISTINSKTINAVNASTGITYTQASTLYISGAPAVTGTNAVITNAYALNVNAGAVRIGNLAASQALATDANKNLVSVANTGTGNNVLATSPTLVTPALGAATATSINKVAITAPATSATLTLAQGSTLATSGAFSTTLTATGTTNVTLPASGTLATTAGTETLTGKTLTTPKLTGYTVATLPTGTTGMVAYVTDAVAPTFLGPLTGGGSVVTPVFYNGTAWVAH